MIWTTGRLPLNRAVLKCQLPNQLLGSQLSILGRSATLLYKQTTRQEIEQDSFSRHFTGNGPRAAPLSKVACSDALRVGTETLRVHLTGRLWLQLVASSSLTCQNGAWEEVIYVAQLAFAVADLILLKWPYVAEGKGKSTLWHFSAAATKAWTR